MTLLRKSLHGLAALAAAASVALVPAASAIADYPDRPIRFIVPWPPGGAADMMARTIGEHLASELGQSVVVENRPGAGGIIGTELAARSEPDGHTLLLGSTGPNSIAASLYSNLPYDPVADFTPITQITELPLLLSVNADLPFNSAGELIAYARENPGKVNFGSVGEGTAQHLASEIFRVTADLDMVHVPYAGSTPAFTALASGEVDMLFDNVMASKAMIDAGRIRPLGISSLTRSSGMPEVPTIDETALEGFQVVAFQNILVPAGTPEPIVNRLNEIIVSFLNTPEMQERLSALGATVVGNTAAEEKQRIIDVVATWGRAVEAAGISLQYE